MTKSKCWRDILPVHPAAELFPLMSPEELKVLGEDIKKNGLFIPTVLSREDPPRLVDGRNRLDAMELAGVDVIPSCINIPSCSDFVDLDHIYVVLAKGIDPYEYVISANIHRRHLTAEQKRDLIATLIKATPEKSNASIAKQVKVDDKTVAKVRRDLEATSEIPRLQKTTGADGKARKKPTKKKRRTEDDFRRDLQAKKVAAVATAMPGDIGPMLPTALPPPVDAVAANPITAAWDNASNKQRQEFVKLRRVEITCVEANSVAAEAADDLDDGIPPFLRRAAP